MAGTMVYRRRVGAADEEHMAAFRNAMTAIQALGDQRGYNHVAGYHGAPGWYCWHHQRNPRTPLQARLFLPWHRAYLWDLEQKLQDQVEGAALPWWDWTRESGVPPAYGAAQIDGAPNPLQGSRARVPTANPPINRRTRRQPGQSPFARLPTAPGVEALYSDSDWASFADRLQNYHDNVHGWVGGDMGDVTTAAFDPIFFAHHCMIDRIWYLWQVRHGNGGVPSSLLGLVLDPFNKTVRDVLDVQTLGYEYASASTEIPVGGGNG